MPTKPKTAAPALAPQRPKKPAASAGASLGLSGVQKVMGTVIRNIIGRMGDRRLPSVCGSIRQFMV